MSHVRGGWFQMGKKDKGNRVVIYESGQRDEVEVLRKNLSEGNEYI